MKMISWNVNGLRACMGKGFESFFRETDADIFCIQETKMQEGQLIFEPEGYHQFWNSAEKKGYSGTAIFTKLTPRKVIYDLDMEAHGQEGRVITLEFDAFFLVNVYTPNSQKELARLPYRMKWDEDFKQFVKQLDDKKPVVICGDLNVAHQEIDLKNPKTNRKNAGFSDEERAKFGELLQAGFVDTYRYFYPDREGAYTWWSYMFNARVNNAGWRIDYFLASYRLMDHVKDSCIYPQVMGSDHCPVGLLLAL